MLAVAMGRLLRMLRIRRGWRQSDVAVKARLSPAVIGRHENGAVGSLSTLEKHAAVFGLRLELRLLGRAGHLVRLSDEEHAAIVETMAGWFRAAGFMTETEASFSEWGERGRVDLLAFDPRAGTLVIVEIKTQLLDLQDLFGALNVKERLVQTIADRRSWAARRRVTILAVAATAANREIVRTHPALFAAYGAERLTRAAIEGASNRMLHWVTPERAERSSWIAGRQRVRRIGGKPAQLSAEEAYDSGPPESGPVDRYLSSGA
jgi:transcriptional regulator with XRE-family HTH domain